MSAAARQGATGFMAGFDGNPWSQGRHFQEKARGIACEQGKRIGPMRMARDRPSEIAVFRQNPPRTLPISAGSGSVRLDALRIVLGFGLGNLFGRMSSGYLRSAGWR